MFGPILNPTRGFWGFPAGSLPRLRFLQGVVPKPMIARDFLAREEPKKIFTLSFPARQGKMEAALPGRLSAPLAPLRWGEDQDLSRSCKRCPRPLLWREHAD